MWSGGDFTNLEKMLTCRDGTNPGNTEHTAGLCGFDHEHRS